jgi:hypothetical protein
MTGAPSEGRFAIESTKVFVDFFYISPESPFGNYLYVYEYIANIVFGTGIANR